jgi:cyclase
VIEWVKKLSNYNFGELLLTSIDADGLCGGFDVELYETVSKIINIPIIACGGFGNLNHIRELKKFADIDAISVSKAIHYDKINIREIKNFIEKIDE